MHRVAPAGLSRLTPFRPVARTFALAPSEDEATDTKLPAFEDNRSCLRRWVMMGGDTYVNRKNDDESKKAAQSTPGGAARPRLASNDCCATHQPAKGYR